MQSGLISSIVNPTLSDQFDYILNK